MPRSTNLLCVALNKYVGALAVMNVVFLAACDSSRHVMTQTVEQKGESKALRFVYEYTSPLELGMSRKDVTRLISTYEAALLYATTEYICNGGRKTLANGTFVEFGFDSNENICLIRVTDRRIRLFDDYGVGTMLKELGNPKNTFNVGPTYLVEIAPSVCLEYRAEKPDVSERAIAIQLRWKDAQIPGF